MKGIMIQELVFNPGVLVRGQINGSIYSIMKVAPIIIFIKWYRIS